jgi:glycosyltransferase involved in cell wall biosynthesis
LYNEVVEISNDQRILFLSSNEGEFGGSEDLWSQTAIYLRKKGYNIAVSVYEKNPEPNFIQELRQSGCIIFQRIRPYGPKTYESIKNFHPCVVIISQGNSFEADDWMEYFYKNGIPYINIIQCAHEAMWVFLPDDRIDRFKKLFLQSKKVFFVSEENRKLTEKILGSNLHNYDIVRNPYKVKYDGKLAWPEEKTLRIGFVARLENFHKGHDLLFEVLKNEKWRRRNLNFHIYGSGPHQRQMKRLVKLWDIPNVYFEGYISNIQSVWEKCHACIQPSRLEGLPLTIVEAMLCARMVIATSVAGNSEVVVDGSTGFLAKAATVEFLDEALERAWGKKDLWKALGENAREHIRKIVPKDPVKNFADQIFENSKDFYQSKITSLTTTPAEVPVNNMASMHEHGNDVILFISNEGAVSGAPMILLHLAKWLNENTNWELRFLTKSYGPIVERLAKYGNSFCFDQISYNKDILEKLMADVSLVYSNTCANIDIVRTLNHNSIPVITHVHELNSVFEICTENCIDELKKHTNFFIACSNSVADNLILNHDIPSDKVSIHHEGIPVEEIQKKAAPNQKRKVRRKYGINKNDFVIVSCGLAHWRKGTDLLIKVAYNLKKLCEKNDISFIFLWIGRVISNDMLASYRHDIKNLGVEDVFRFINEINNPFPLISASDLFCLPSREDPFPLVMLESAALEKAGVCFNGSGGGPEFYSQGGGVIVPYSDTMGMAEAIQNLINDQAALKSMGSVGKKIVEQKYHSDIMASGIAGKIREIIPKNSNHRIDTKYIKLPKDNIKTYMYPVSVIVPNYNYANYLEIRLKSILEQTYSNLEIIVLDDFSSDNSVEILKEYEKYENIKLTVNKKNRGSVFKQWIKGIKEANGDIIWIAEADDFSDINFVESLIPEFNNNDVIMSYCSSCCIDTEGRIINNYNYYDNYLKGISITKWLSYYCISGKNEVADGLAIKNTIPNVSGVLFRKSILQNILDDLRNQIEKFKFCGDWYLYLNLLKRGWISYIPKKLNYHRRHENSVVRKYIL